jgi:hypothetical protein
LHPSRQYYLLFAPSGDIIFYFAPRLCPSSILFSIQLNGHTILAQYFSIWPYGCASSGKILLITHQGFIVSGFFASCPGAHSYLILHGFHSLALVLLLLQLHVTNSLLHPF